AALSLVLPCSVPVAVLAAHWSGAGWAFRVGVWVYLAALALDFVAGVDESPMWDGFSTRPFRVITWLWVPLQATLLVTGLLAERGGHHGHRDDQLRRALRAGSRRERAGDAAAFLELQPPREQLAAVQRAAPFRPSRRRRAAVPDAAARRPGPPASGRLFRHVR